MNERVNSYQDSATGKPRAQKGQDGAAHALSMGLGAQTHPESPELNGLKVILDAYPVQVTGTTETVVMDVPCYLVGFYANDASSGHIDLRNAAATAGGSTPVLDIDATAYASGQLPCKFSEGITAQGSAAGTDVTFFVKEA